MPPSAHRRDGLRGAPLGHLSADPRAEHRPFDVAGPHSGPGPLVARLDPARRSRPAPVSTSGRVTRFVRRWGWRAYAIPLLTVATFLTLLDAAGSQQAPAAAADTAASDTVTGVLQGDVLAGDPASGSTSPSVAAAEGEGGPVDVEPSPPVNPDYVQQGAGTVSVVDGSSQVYGTGPLERFVVEVEDGIDVDGAQFAAAVEATLSDPRSWGAAGRMSFQRVGAAEASTGDYDFRVTLVSPGNMETYCPGVGTGGYTSCRYGERAVINLARWETAVPDYAGDIATYRQYVVNHEVGHALGNGHEFCAGPGQLAPVMQQQTLGLEGCVANAWPYPL